ncbi:MAG: tetratricopeptide repeat protein [Actinomycetota bacterium]|nr:tetratricopeptide repeat protein [Actinomycetota bacterium]
MQEDGMEEKKEHSKSKTDQPIAGCGCPHHHAMRVPLKDRAIMLALVVGAVIFALRPLIALQSISRANSYLEIGDFGRAAVHYERAIFLKDDLATAHSNLGYAYAQDGKVELAKASLLRAVELNPSDPQPLIELMHILREEGFIEEAINHYEMVKDRVPKGTVLLSLAGLLYEEAGEVEKAIESWESFLRLMPDSSLAKEHLEGLQGFALKP